MLVNDAFGRKVSLLNDTDGPLPKPSPPSHSSSRPRCPSRSNASYFSRKSSYSSQMSHCSESSHTSVSEDQESPAYSPGLRPAPQLLRFDSTSSQQSLHTPSPISPTYQIDPMDQSKTFTGNPNDPYFRQATGPYFAPPQQPLPGVSQSPSLFAPLDSPQAFPLTDPYVPLQASAVQFAPYATDLIPTPPVNLTSPTTAVTPAASSPDRNTNSSGAKPAKKKYPCPHAAKYNCTDTFTTSGHAARHGKKHTGEKNIRCPVCDKAFTRKDNMKQHERTHRNNRDTASTATNESKKAKPLKTESTDTSTEMDVDSVSDDGQSTIRAKPVAPRRPALSQMQPATTLANHVDVIMPVTLDSNEQLQQVAPELKLDPVDRNYAALGDAANKFQENIFAGRPVMLDRNPSSGSGFGSQDGEGESPGLDALAMAASMS